MKLGKFILIAVAVSLISFSLTLLFYSYYIVQDVQELGMKMKVGDVVGVDTNNSVISFGIIPAGGSGERPIILKNMWDEPLKVNIKKSGEMAKWVYFSENGFILEKNETKEIKAKAVPSDDARKGVYTGEVKFIFTRVI